MKKILASAFAVSMAVGLALSASVQAREAAPMGEAEGVISTPILIGLFALAGLGTVLAIESAEDPASS
jgi:hypothetical protein